MSNPIQSVNSALQIDQTLNRPTPQKTPTTNQNAIPQDTVTLSSAAQQAQGTSKAAGGDKDHDGDSR